MHAKKNSDTATDKPVLALAVMTIIWGYNWVVMKEALSFCGPFVFAAMRAFPAALCLFGILLWSKKNWRPRQVKWTILLGLLSTTLGLGLPIWSLVSGGAGKTAVLLYTMPFWVILLAWPILGERIRGLEWLAVILAFAGLVVYNIVVTSVVAYLLWFYILEKLPAGIATMGTLVTPVIAILAAAVQLGEIPTLYEKVGIILILSGIGLLSAIAFLRTRRVRVTPPTAPS